MAQDDPYRRRRQAMVAHHLLSRGIADPKVIAAMARVRREAFVPEPMRELAYDDGPLPIAAGQTISQPYVVAWMVEALALSGGERVLDVGTGSGYAAAVLACIAGEVFSIERVPELAEQARQALASEGFDNVTVICGDGSEGWPEAAPYQGISVAAGAPAVPEALKHQLRVGGRLVIPVGDRHGSQMLVQVTRTEDERFDTQTLGGVRFVPLLGEQGWRDRD